MPNPLLDNRQLGPDVARTNLLTNGGFEIWQRGNGPFTSNSSADRWILQPGTGSTMSVSKDTTNVDTSSAAAAAVTYTHSTRTYFSQVLTESAAQLAGRTISFSVRVRTATPNAVQLGIGWTNPTLITTSGVYHSGNGAYATLTQTIAVPAGIGALYAYVVFDASCTAYLDNAMLVVGSQPANYVPLHPADDLARCLRYYEVVGTGYWNVYQAFPGAASQNMFWAIPLKGIKAVTPTLTKLGTWTLTNVTSQPTLAYANPSGLALNAVNTAAGMAYVQPPTDGSVFITAESNPLLIPVGLLMMQGAQPDYVIYGLALIAAWMMGMDAKRTADLTRRLRQLPSLDCLIDRLRSPASAIGTVAVRMFCSIFPGTSDALFAKRGFNSVTLSSPRSRSFKIFRITMPLSVILRAPKWLADLAVNGSIPPPGEVDNRLGSMAKSARSHKEILTAEANFP